MSDDEAGLSAAHTAKGKLQRALLDLLRVHEREGTLPTSNRFLFYELVQAGVVPKAATGKRRADQNLIDALTHLREAKLVPWSWIVDETRTMTSWRTAPTVAEYVARSVDRAALDRWGGHPAPLILCESRSLAGALHDLSSEYACPIAPTNGQAKGFLITEVAPRLRPMQRVLYLGDWDHCGHQIEAATKRTLCEHAPVWDMSHAVQPRRRQPWVPAQWERIALTTEQVDSVPGLRDLVISKPDRRYKPVRYFDAVETEAFGQANIVAALRARLDQLMPEPLADVLERERRQRAEVAEQLRRIADGSDDTP
jgi:hypothetical protein